jgi:hypothetical protein
MGSPQDKLSSASQVIHRCTSASDMQLQENMASPLSLNTYRSLSVAPVFL